MIYILLVVLLIIILVIVSAMKGSGMGSRKADELLLLQNATVEDCLFNKMLGRSTIIENGRVVDFIDEEEEN